MVIPVNKEVGATIFAVDATAGRYGMTGIVEGNVFQRTVEYPDEFAPGYHAVLDDETVVTVRWDQVAKHRPSPR